MVAMAQDQQRQGVTPEVRMGVSGAPIKSVYVGAGVDTRTAPRLSDRDLEASMRKEEMLRLTGSAPGLLERLAGVGATVATALGGIATSVHFSADRLGVARALGFGVEDASAAFPLLGVAAGLLAGMAFSRRSARQNDLQDGLSRIANERELLRTRGAQEFNMKG